MAKDPKDTLVKWLNDAYGMEKLQQKVLESHAKGAAEYPEIQARLEQHLEETRGHAEIVERCLAKLDEKPSAVKAATATIMGVMQGSSGGSDQDELVKNTISDYAAENFEIASYAALQQYALLVGYDEIAEMCNQIIAQEENMAQFLGQNLPTIVEIYAAETLADISPSMQPAFGERIDREDDRKS